MDRERIDNSPDFEAGPSHPNRRSLVQSETIIGYHHYLSRVRALGKEAEKDDDQIIVLFTASGTPGKCWCPDCNYLEDILTGFMNKPKGLHGYFLRVLVGYQEEWKTPSCPYRLDPVLHLKTIPTVMNWISQKQLSGIQVFEVDRLLDLFGQRIVDIEDESSKAHGTSGPPQQKHVD